MYNRYTVTLRDIMKSASTAEALQKALSTYPIYTPTSKNEYIPNIIPTREDINKKLLDHYKYREIGFETVGRFLEELEISMCEIMPYYNQLMFTQDQDFNIIYNVDYVRTTDTDRDDNKSQTGSDSNSASGTSGVNVASESHSTEVDDEESTSTSHDKNVKSDTPQNDVSSVTAKNIDSVDYASEVEWHKGDTNITSDNTKTSDTSNSSTSSETTSTTGQSSYEASEILKGKEKSVETTKGNFGVMATQDLIKKYREIILNIEQMIINDERISELFMRVY